VPYAREPRCDTQTRASHASTDASTGEAAAAAGLELTFSTQFLVEADARILLDDAAGFWGVGDA